MGDFASDHMAFPTIDYFGFSRSSEAKNIFKKPLDLLYPLDIITSMQSNLIAPTPAGSLVRSSEMKTQITVDSNNVTVTCDDPFTGERTSTTYFAPHTSSGQAGYVRIRDSAGRYPQVCEGLSSTGNTLMATPETLPAVIRRELRRRIAATRRELDGQ